MSKPFEHKQALISAIVPLKRQNLGRYMRPSEKTFARRMGAFLSGVESRLACFEDEDQPWILQRTGKR